MTQISELVPANGNDLADAEADARTALDIARQHRLDHLLPYATAFLAGIRLERGNHDGAAQLIEHAALPAQLVGSPAELVLLEWRGRVRCATGHADAGMADLRACGAVVQALKISNPIVSPWRSDLVPELVRTAINEARHLAAADLEVARRTGLPRAIGAALRTVAACEPDARAVDLLGEAVEVLTGSPAVLELARVLLDRGAALRRLRHPVEAREPLREALEIATRCGAMTLAERAHAEALLAGARPRRARLTGIHALTPGELRVARLAADGRSNREIAEALFLTTKTVKDHLGSCYGKLSIASRDELTRALSQPEP